MSEAIERSNERYVAAAHAMQTAVAVKMRHDGKDTEPKHLRVGINSAHVSAGGLATLLIEKGVITQEEYHTAMADAMEREAAQYRQELIDAGYLDPNVTLG